MKTSNNFAYNLEFVQENIERAKNAVGRNNDNVMLTVVSKTQPQKTIRCILQIGHRVFAENRVQEALEKWPLLKKEFTDIKLHLIGSLQTNKVKHALSVFDVIETVDRPKLARELAKTRDRMGCELECFIQINTGDEEQKSGVLPEDADNFIESCRKDYELPIVGLMCIPPINEEPRLHFALLAKIAKRNGLEKLSMGMSRDYEKAIELGATGVRIGTAIFGMRD